MLTESCIWWLLKVFTKIVQSGFSSLRLFCIPILWIHHIQLFWILTNHHRVFLRNKKMSLTRKLRLYSMQCILLKIATACHFHDISKNVFNFLGSNKRALTGDHKMKKAIFCLMTSARRVLIRTIKIIRNKLRKLWKNAEI